MSNSTKMGDEQKLRGLIENATRIARTSGLTALDDGMIASVCWDIHLACRQGLIVAAPEAYMRQCLRNAAITAHRQDARWMRALQAPSETRDVPVAPFEQAANREIVELAQSLLTPTEQVLFWLLHEVGLTQHQAAECLGVKPLTVHRARSRAIRRLRRRLASVA
ncbi:MAG: sigma-70 family RNA polymerase sigma factor [Phycisphaerales bacterium]|nr:sigma-70 family RNA polymerase sigma factor [Phycisphaerales bacterium]